MVTLNLSILIVGKRYAINKILTNADNVLDKDIFYPLNEKYKEYVGSYYSPFKVKKILEEIDEIIENNDLQFMSTMLKK